MKFKKPNIRLIVFLLLFLCNAGGLLSQKKITIVLKDQPIRNALKLIEDQSEISFFYNEDFPFLDKKVSITAINKTVPEVLTDLLSGSKSKFYSFENLIVIGPSSSINPVTVRGIITDAHTDKPMAGVNLVVEGTLIGTTTDTNGKYSITSPNPENRIAFSYIGYKTEYLSAPTNKEENIRMVSDLQNLNEVISIGYGSQEKLTVTGSVSSVNIDQMLKSPASSIQNALTGRAAGLMIIQRSGEPGRDYAEIYIRGQSTFGNSNPLILIDGIERDLKTLDPYEVESIQILKDASSTAVFGVRGANGVIIITTKVGEYNSKPQISFSSNYGISNIIGIPEFLKAAEWTRFYNLGSKNDHIGDQNWQPTFKQHDIDLYKSGKDPVFHPDTDWKALLTKKNVPQQQYNLNIKGGTLKSRYFISLGYFSQEGAFDKVEDYIDFPVNSSVKRYNIRANTDFKWSENFSSSIKISTQILSGKYPAGSSMSDILNNVFANSPIVSPPLVDGKIISDTPELSQYKTGENPLLIFYSLGAQTQYKSIINFDMASTYKLDRLIKGLSLRGKVTMDNLYSQFVTRNRNINQYEVRRISEEPYPNNYTLVQTTFESPWFTQNQVLNQSLLYYYETSINYQNTFQGGHTVRALALGTVESTYKGGNPALPYKYMGAAGRLVYNYRRKYMGEINLGYNGSENFAKGKQFGLFPSFSLGYVVSEEKFFPDQGLVTFLKLRASYGKVGNDRIGGERFLYQPNKFELSHENPGDEKNATYYFGYNRIPANGYVENKIGNPDISWEVSAKMNFGIEAKLFNGKLYLSGDLFNEDRTGILSNYQRVPFTFGDIRLLPSYNLGNVNNKGFELDAEFSDTRNKEFRYWVSGNFSFARNKIVFMDEVPSGSPNLNRTGKRINQPFMLVANGFYNTWDEINDPSRIPSVWELSSPIQPGDFRYVDLNDDGIIDLNDEKAIGYSNIPEIMYGISGGFCWRGLSLSFLIQGADNVSTYYGNKTIFASGFGARTVAAYDAWTEEKYLAGEPILYPRISNLNNDTHNTQTNSMLVQNARYTRLKNIEIGYNFNQSVFKRFEDSDFTIFVNGLNLLTITPMKYWDPEMVQFANPQYPITKTINMGFRATF